MPGGPDGSTPQSNAGGRTPDDFNKYDKKPEKKKCYGVCEFLRQAAAVGVGGVCGGVAAVVSTPEEATNLVAPGSGIFLQGASIGIATGACYVGTYEALGAIGGVE